MATKTAKTIDDIIKAAIKSAVSSRQLIQEAGIAILIHADKHGDWTKANVLVNGLPDSIRKDSLVQWFVQFGGLEADESVGEFIGWSGADHIRTHFEAAKETYWDTVKKPTNPWKGFDLKAEIARLVDKANKEMKKHKDSPELKVDRDTLAALATLAGQL